MSILSRRPGTGVADIHCVRAREQRGRRLCKAPRDADVSPTARRTAGPLSPFQSTTLTNNTPRRAFRLCRPRKFPALARVIMHGRQTRRRNKLNKDTPNRTTCGAYIENPFDPTEFGRLVRRVFRRRFPTRRFGRSRFTPLFFSFSYPFLRVRSRKKT